MEALKTLEETPVSDRLLHPTVKKLVYSLGIKKKFFQNKEDTRQRKG